MAEESIENILKFPKEGDPARPEDDLEVRESKSWPEKIWYDGTRFWLENIDGHWVSLPELATRRFLKKCGVSSDLTKEERLAGLKLTEVDKIIAEVELNRRVAWAGPLAGRPAGVYVMGGQRIIVTAGPDLIRPEKPDEADDSIPRIDPSEWPYERPSDAVIGECIGWPYLGRLWRNMFTCLRTPETHPGDVADGYLSEDCDQLLYFLGWLQRSMLGLYLNQRVRGHGILLAGEPNCGKSLTIWLLQQMFGGRIARPLGWIEGRTQFNSNMFKAPLLVVDDEGAKTKIQDRKILSAQFKQVVAVMSGEMEGKGRDELELEPFWRLVFATNLEEQNLLVFPPIDDDIRDKVMLFKCYKEAFPWSDKLTEPEIQKLFAEELPYFLHWLMAEFKLPEELYHQRFGLHGWLHPEIRQKIEYLSPEMRVWNYIERTVLKAPNKWDGVDLPPGVWMGTASDLEEDLRDPENPLTYKEREKIPMARPTLGKYLMSLKEMPAFQGMLTLKRTRAGRIWTLKAREVVDRENSNEEKELNLENVEDVF